jgi:hypothetical protein
MRNTLRSLFILFLTSAILAIWSFRFEVIRAQEESKKESADIYEQAIMAIFTVTNTADSGPGSLRQAILDANSNAGLDQIDFAIPGTGPFTIQPTSALPAITEAVVIDGYTQSGAITNGSCSGIATLQVVIRGVSAGPSANGLTLASSGSTVRGLVINGFGGNGIEISGNSNNINGNFIGTNATGTAAAANGANGIQITSGTGNIIGGSTPAARNVISGNLFHGISVGSDSSANTIIGNYIGTNASGSAALGNGVDGINLFQSGGNIIGGNATTALGCAPGNLISGNNEDGIGIAGQLSRGNAVQGNLIGTNASGTSDLGNSSVGIEINASANGIGGATATTRNIISGNDGGGVVIGGGNSNLVQGNYIGTNLAGTAAIRNPDGIRIDTGADNNQIGNGFEDFPFFANSGTNVLIRFNLSGTVRTIGAITGLQAGEEILGMDFRPLNNQLYGLGVNTSTGTARLYTINPTTAVATQVGTSSFSVTGTQFGFDFNPLVDRIRVVSNTGENLRLNPNNGGVTVDPPLNGATTQADAAAYTNTFVGATGTTLYDIDINSDALYIQTNPNAGTTAFVGPLGFNATQLSGFDIRPADNTAYAALIPSGGNTNLYTINLSTGEASFVANLGGRFLRALAISDGNSGQANLISGNDVGVYIAGGNNNFVRGNFIGTQADGTSDLGNLEAGVYVHEPKGSNNSIGGAAVGAGNVIRFNGDGTLIPTLFGEGGVIVFAGSTGNNILGNSISENTGLGIDLGENGSNGVTPNDGPGDLDSGNGNNYQNFPTLVSASNSSGPTIISGSLVSTGNRAFRIEFFSDTTADPSGNGEGRVFLGSQNITTTAAGTATISFTSPVFVPNGNVVTSTATDLTTGDTSEFSQPVTVGGSGSTGLESDTDPRNSGNGTLNSGDVVQIRRFVNLTDTAVTSPNEFQRADAHPFSSRGDAVINSGDVVQTRRYINGTDPQQAAGGPTAPSFSSDNSADEKISDENALVPPQPRGLRIQSVNTTAGSTVVVNVRVDTNGDEAEYQYQINYNQSILSNPVVMVGNVGGAPGCNTAVPGRVSCSTGNFPNNNPSSSDPSIGEIPAGNNLILISIQFNVAANAPNGTTPITFSPGANAASDAPVVFNLATANGGVTITGGVGNTRGLILEDKTGSPGGNVTVNLRVDAIGDEAEYAYGFTYDSSLLMNPVVAIGNVGGTHGCNTSVSGRITCSTGAFPNNNPSSSDPSIGEIPAGAGQILIRITFTISPSAQSGTITPLKFLPGANAASDQPTVFNLQTTDGVVTILSPTAASVTVGGRVLSSAGRGIPKAYVTMTDRNGQERTVVTNSFGYYRFVDVQAGETYVFRVSAKKYTF